MVGGVSVTGALLQLHCGSTMERNCLILWSRSLVMHLTHICIMVRWPVEHIR